MKIMVTSFKMSHTCTATVSAPSPAARDTWTLMGKSRAVSCGITAPFSWVLECTRFCLCLPVVCFPVLCRFWRLYGGLNGDLLQEGLCHTEVCSTQSPCGRPLLTHTSTGDTQTVLAPSLCAGHAFCVLPRSAQLRQPGAWRVQCSSWAVCLNQLPGPGCSVFRARCESTVSPVLYVSSGELISSCETPGGCQPSRISGRRG